MMSVVEVGTITRDSATVITNGKLQCMFLIAGTERKISLLDTYINIANGVCG